VTGALRGLLQISCTVCTFARTDDVTGESLCYTLSVLCEKSLRRGEVDRALHATVPYLHALPESA
jgi:hypothetical protein